MTLTFRRFGAAAALTIFMIGSVAETAPAELSAKKSTFVSISGSFEVKAPPAKVWSLVTSLEGFYALTGFKPEPVDTTLAKVQTADSSRSFTRVGDFVKATMWNDGGKLVVTDFVEEKELRVCWEPDNGHYLSSRRVILDSTPEGTNVQYWDRYTEDYESVDETAAQVVKEG